MDYYSKNAKEYINATLNVDMSNLYDDFLIHLKPKSKILDIGFGSGRDSIAFFKLGYDVYSIDTCKEFCEHAINKGLKHVKNISVENISKINFYDGIWACASLLHIEKDKLKDILIKCTLALKENGIMYLSFKYGDFSGIRNERHYTDLNEKELENVLTGTGLKINKIIITSDTLNRDNKWLNAYLIKKQ